MIKRQPADKDIVRAGPDGAAHGADIGEQVGMRQDHPLGVAGTA